MCDHGEAFKETNGNAIGYTTAIPTVTTAKLVLAGKWGGTGVKIQKTNLLIQKSILKKWQK